MNIRTFRRIIEIFFQRWPLYLLLLAAFVGFGLFRVSRAEPAYTSSGTIFVDNQSLVSAQSGVQGGNGFSYLSPAQFTSQELYGLIQTDVFMDSVLERSEVELPSDPTDRAREVGSLRSGMSSFASSQNLVKVFVSSDDPDLSYRLTDSIIAEFVQFQIGLDVAESGASEVFFSDLADTYQADLDAARDEVDNALRGVDNLEELPLARQLQIERLREAESMAEARYQAAVEDIEVSRLAGLQTETDIRQSYSTFDPPQRPSEPDGGVLDGLMLLMLAAAAGLIAALFWPVVSGFTSRTVLFADELENVAVLGTVPRIRKRQIRLKNLPIESGVVLGSDDGESIDLTEQASRTITFKSRPSVTAPQLSNDIATEPKTRPDSSDRDRESARNRDRSAQDRESARNRDRSAQDRDRSARNREADLGDEVPAVADWDPVTTMQFDLPPNLPSPRNRR